MWRAGSWRPRRGSPRPTRLVIRFSRPEAYEPPDEPFEMPGESMIGLGGSHEDRPPTPPSGVLDLHGLLRDGRPAAKAVVNLQYLETQYALGGLRATLDGEGRLKKDLPEGTWEVTFYEPGLVHSMQTFEIRRGETARARLHEGQGGTIRLRVVDSAGRPLPFARSGSTTGRGAIWRTAYSAWTPTWTRTDPARCASLSSDQPLQVTAWYAGGHNTVRCPVREGETIDVTRRGRAGEVAVWRPPPTLRPWRPGGSDSTRSSSRPTRPRGRRSTSPCCWRSC